MDGSSSPTRHPEKGRPQERPSARVDGQQPSPLHDFERDAPQPSTSKADKAETSSGQPEQGGRGGDGNGNSGGRERLTTQDLINAFLENKRHQGSGPSQDPDATPTLGPQGSARRPDSLTPPLDLNATSTLGPQDSARRPDSPTPPLDLNATAEAAPRYQQTGGNTVEVPVEYVPSGSHMLPQASDKNARSDAPSTPKYTQQELRKIGKLEKDRASYLKRREDPRQNEWRQKRQEEREEKARAMFRAIAPKGSEDPEAYMERMRQTYPDDKYVP